MDGTRWVRRGVMGELIVSCLLVSWSPGLLGERLAQRVASCVCSNSRVAQSKIGCQMGHWSL